MIIRIVINSAEIIDGKEQEGEHRTEIFRGDVNIERDSEYITKISIIADGEPQPICDVPFSPGIGHYIWIPGDYEHREPEHEPPSYYDIAN